MCLPMKLLGILILIILGVLKTIPLMFWFEVFIGSRFGTFRPQQIIESVLKYVTLEISSLQFCKLILIGFI